MDIDIERATVGVVHAPERSRYEIVADDTVVGFADYRTADDALVFTHTIIDRDLRGHELGERLVQSALDDVRRQGKRVVPRCWFVAEFIATHPEYKEMRAA